MNAQRSETEFVDGLRVYAPHERAPDFVKASISIKRAELIAWLQSREGDWVNVDVKESKGGKWYAAVNDYNRDERAPSKPVKDCPQPDQGGFEDDSIPF
jgi:hypothetical protein